MQYEFNTSSVVRIKKDVCLSNRICILEWLSMVCVFFLFFWECAILKIASRRETNAVICFLRYIKEYLYIIIIVIVHHTLRDEGFSKTFPFVSVVCIFHNFHPTIFVISYIHLPCGFYFYPFIFSWIPSQQFFCPFFQ